MERRDILYAKRTLHQMHPLYYLEVETALPVCDPIIGCTRRWARHYEICGAGKPEDKGLIDPTFARSEVNIEDAATMIQDDGTLPGEPKFDFDLEEGEDPMGRLGYGIVSYFQLIWTFLIIFFLLTCGHIPMMYNYATWSAYEGEKQLSLTTQLTIGNLGQSMPRCAAIKMVGNQLPIGCNTGSITSFTHIGVYAFNSEADHNGVCSTGNSTESFGNDCDSLSDKTSPLFQKLDDCIGKQSCIVDNVHDYITVGKQFWDPGCEVGPRDTLFV